MEVAKKLYAAALQPSEQSSPTSVAAFSPRGMAPRPSLRPSRSSPRRSSTVPRSKSISRDGTATPLSLHRTGDFGKNPRASATTPRHSSVPWKPSSAPSSRRTSLYRSSPTNRELKAMMERAERDEVSSLLAIISLVYHALTLPHYRI